MAVTVDDSGYIIAETARFLGTRLSAGIKEGVTLAQAAINSRDAISNFKKLSRISERAISIEEQEQKHLRDTYWPRELQFLNEFTKPRRWDTQATLAKRYAGRMWAPVAGAFAKKLKELELNRQRYHGKSYMHAVQELTVAMSQTKANLFVLADRIAFAEVQAVNDTDFERRKQAIALRQGLIGQAAALMASAAEGLAGAGAEAAKAATDAVRALGYFNNREDMQPQQTESDRVTQRSNMYTEASPLEQYFAQDTAMQPIQTTDLMQGIGDITSATPAAVEVGPVSDGNSWQNSFSANSGPQVISIGDGTI